jgi:uncharacterized damage-inducible protein DinB
MQGAGSGLPGGVAMKMTDLFAAQMEREAAINRRVLERVPEGKGDWKPHDKSMSLGYLSYLVANMPSWVENAINRDELDLNPPAGGSQYKPRSDMSRSELRAAHDDAVARAMTALRKTNDDFLMTGWKLLVATKVVMESPRHEVIADTYTHMAHHRGQLTVYLRLNGEKVPSVYGPTADDKSFG